VVLRALEKTRAALADGGGHADAGGVDLASGSSSAVHSDDSSDGHRRSVLASAGFADGVMLGRIGEFLIQLMVIAGLIWSFFGSYATIAVKPFRLAAFGSFRHSRGKSSASSWPCLTAYSFDAAHRRVDWKALSGPWTALLKEYLTMPIYAAFATLP